MIAKYIEHPGIAAQNPKELTQWYIKTLGMELKLQPGETTFFIACKGGGIIEIYQAKFSAPPLENNYVRGLCHIAFYVDDFDQAYDDLITQGVEVAATPMIIPPRLKLALFRDPEGNLFHITQRDLEIL